MHPAPSIIVFTVLSGLGFGMLAWLGIGQPAVTGWTAFGYFLLAFALAVGGLVSSTFHLGHPERAWRALTQWQSSWLSREGVMAVITLILMGIYAFSAVFFGNSLTLLGWLGAASALVTVYTTSMIYAQMKTIPRWNNWTVPGVFLALSLTGGAILTGQVLPATILLIFSGLLVALHWLQGDTAFQKSGTTLSTATGLHGTVRAFEPPHTGTNYLLTEMVHVLGRKHAVKLRVIGFGLLVALPLILCLAFPNPFGFVLAAFSHIAGALVSRWLFFAEAEHVVGLYYGMR